MRLAGGGRGGAALREDMRATVAAACAAAAATSAAAAVATATATACFFSSNPASDVADDRDAPTLPASRATTPRPGCSGVSTTGRRKLHLFSLGVAPGPGPGMASACGLSLFPSFLPPAKKFLSHLPAFPIAP